MENSSSDAIRSNKKSIENIIRDLLQLLGDDANREGLVKTPHRVAKMYGELLRGYSKNLDDVVNGAVYEVKPNHSVVMIDNIPFQSLCEHHLLPFTGKAHIAYLPSDKIIGLSKIPRIVDMYAMRLQIQERMTGQIADAITEVLEPRGLAVLITGEHSCASLRGVKKQGILMKTNDFRGDYKTNNRLRSEFLQMMTIR